MVDSDFDALMQAFVECAEDYLNSPDFVKGMKLHDLAVHAGVACNSRLGNDGSIVAAFHEFKRAIPQFETARLEELLNKIKYATAR